MCCFTGNVPFIDLSGYPKFFAHLRAAFPVTITRGEGSIRSLGPSPEAQALKVHAVSSYEASFVPKLADFTRWPSPSPPATRPSSSSPPSTSMTARSTPEEDVAGVLRLVLDPLGRESRFVAVADPRTNRVFMMGDPRRMNLAAKWIERIDRP